MRAQRDPRFIDRLTQRSAGRARLAPDTDAAVVRSVLLQVHSDRNQDIIISALAEGLTLLFAHPDDLVSPAVHTDLLTQRIRAPEKMFDNLVCRLLLEKKH